MRLRPLSQILKHLQESRPKIWRYHHQFLVVCRHSSSGWASCICKPSVSRLIQQAYFPRRWRCRCGAEGIRQPVDCGVWIWKYDWHHGASDPRASSCWICRSHFSPLFLIDRSCCSGRYGRKFKSCMDTGMKLFLFVPMERFAYEDVATSYHRAHF